MMGKVALLLMLDTRGAVDTGRRKESPAVEDHGGRPYGEGREQRTPTVEDRGGNIYSLYIVYILGAVSSRRPSGRAAGEGDVVRAASNRRLGRGGPRG